MKKTKAQLELDLEAAKDTALIATWMASEAQDEAIRAWTSHRQLREKLAYIIEKADDIPPAAKERLCRVIRLDAGIPNEAIGERIMRFITEGT